MCARVLVRVAARALAHAASAPPRLSLSLPSSSHEPPLSRRQRYFKGAFDLGRVFMFKWTVNFKFLPEDVFVSKGLALALLGCTVFGMLAFVYKWRKGTSKARAAVAKFRQDNADLSNPDVDPRIFVMSPDYIVATLFTSNFIGMAHDSQHAHTLSHSLTRSHTHTQALSSRARSTTSFTRGTSTSCPTSPGSRASTGRCPLRSWPPLSSPTTSSRQRL